MNSSIFLLLAYSIIQTLTGRGRFDVDLHSTAVLTLAGCMFLPVILAVGIGLFRNTYHFANLRNQSALLPCDLRPDPKAFDQ